MPNLFEVKGAAKIRCFGKEAVLDGLKQPAGTLIGRITPDEVIFVGEPGTAAALVEDLSGQLASEGTAALVVDHTDGWSFFTIEGEGVEEVFAREANWKLPVSNGEPVFTRLRDGRRVKDPVLGARARPLRQRFRTSHTDN